MPEPQRIKAEGTTEDVTVTAPIVLHTTDTVMVVGIMDTTMFTGASLVGTKVAAVWIKGGGRL